MLSASKPCAYAFRPEPSKSSIEQNGTAADAFVFDVHLRPHAVQSFFSAVAARYALRDMDSGVQVIIVERQCEVSPLNLAAAIVKDCPARDVYLLNDNPTGTLLARCRYVGARGVISAIQAVSMLGFSPFTAAANTAVSTLASRATLDMPTKELPDQASLLTNRVKNEQINHQGQDSVKTHSYKQNQMSALSQICHQKQADIDGIASSKNQNGVFVLHNHHGEEISHDKENLQRKEMLQGKSDAQVISFISGRGGTGKSTLALLSAVELFRRGCKVALIDLDLQFGDLGYLIGSEKDLQLRRLRINDFARGVANPIVNAATEHQCLTLFEATDSPELAEELVGRLTDILDIIRPQFDVLIINTSSFFNELGAIVA
ncbi:MAG: P-loop NTPase, partial [Coriobacteriales bacterium]|nr:P-loop NTPase [Coriobacteriales bacterium]